MSYDEILELPLKVFTLYNSNINRIRAEKEMRHLRVLASATDGERIKELYIYLLDELGETTETEVSGFVKMEPDAIEKLMGLQNGKTSS